jgi:SdrD B-like domain
VRLSSISGVVYDDRSGDGSRQPAEPGIEGVLMTLTPRVGAARTISTGPGGVYEFTNLPIGTYDLSEAQPSAFDDGTNVIGTGATMNGVLAPPDRVTGIVLGPGQTAADYLFGELARASLAGLVYEDLDDDGFRDSGEAGVGDVLLTLTGPNGTTTQRTGLAGTYRFIGLPAGTYSLVETQPSGYFEGRTVVGTGFASPGVVGARNTVGTIVMRNGEDAVGYDFSELPPAEIRGRVFSDVDGDGVLDAQEVGVDRTVVTLYRTLLGRPTDVVATVTTGSDGVFVFGDLPAGTYALSEAQPALFADGIDVLGIGAVVVGNASHDNATNTDWVTEIELGIGGRAYAYAFGENPYANLDGVVFIDKDNDGVQDANEPGIGGVLMSLSAGKGAPITTRTDDRGRYRFVGLAPGTYDLTEEQPAGFDDGRVTIGRGASAIGTASTNSVVSIELSFGDNAVDYAFSETETTPSVTTTTAVPPATTVPDIDPVTTTPRVPTPGLPITGSDPRNELVLAALFVAFGAAVLVVRRRRVR